MESVQRMRCRERRGFTRIEVVVVAAIIALLVAVLSVGVRITRERGRIEQCINNLKSLGTALYTYVPESGDTFPIPPHVPATEVGRSQVVWAPGKIGLHRGRADDPKAGETTDSDAEMSISRCYWMLIQCNIALPESFICPSSGDRANDESNPGNLWDFRSWNECSYGYQVPYGKIGLPRSDCDQRMAISADKGPFGAALEAGMPNPGVTMPGVGNRDSAWRPWNSPNHKGRGQGVLYADAHAEFKTTPIVGVAQDNIYTRWSDATGGGADINVRIHGTPPTGREAPFSNTESLIYP